jgi:hypothetical protein
MSDHDTRAVPPKRRSKISGQFSARLIEMLESPAYRALSRAAHLLISRIEIELARHGGNENGRLAVTTANFVEYGVHHESVAPAIREAEALGFIRVTERGRGGNAEHRLPNRFYLTFAHSRDSRMRPPTDEWRQIKTIREAAQIARAARAAKNQNAVAYGQRSWRKRQQKQNPDTGFCRISTPKTGTENARVPTPETGTAGSLRKPVLLSISRAGEPSDAEREQRTGLAKVVPAHAQSS